MVSRCDDIHSGVQQFVCQTGRDASPGSRVFPVDDDEVRPVFPFEFRQHVLHGGASGFADHIAYKEYGNHDWDGAGADGGFYCSSLVTGTTRTGTGDFRITELATLPRKTVERKPWLCLPTTIMSMWCFSA